MINNTQKNVVYFHKEVEMKHKNILQSMREIERIEEKQEALFKDVIDAIQIFLNNLNGMTNEKS